MVIIKLDIQWNLQVQKSYPLEAICFTIKLTMDILKRFSFLPQSGSPQPFWHEGPISWKTVFPRTEVGGWFQVIQAHCTYGALYFYYYYYISFTSDHQALDPGSWGLLPYRPFRPTFSWMSALILASW